MKNPGLHRIYMNVGYEVGETQIRNYFMQFGNVLDVYLPKHKSGRNKGFGFTTFETSEELSRALYQTEHKIDGVVVKINRAGPRPESVAPSTQPYQPQPQQSPQPQAVHFFPQGLLNGALEASLHGKGPRIYVGGVADEISEDDVREHFSRWGQVADVYFPGTKGDKRVNYCFVTFDTWQNAQRACNQSERNLKGEPLQSISMAEERYQERQQSSATGPSALHGSRSSLAGLGLTPAGLGLAPPAAASYAGGAAALQGAAAGLLPGGMVPNRYHHDGLGMGVAALPDGYGLVPLLGSSGQLLPRGADIGGGNSGAGGGAGANMVDGIYEAAGSGYRMVPLSAGSATDTGPSLDNPVGQRWDWQQRQAQEAESILDGGRYGAAAGWAGGGNAGSVQPRSGLPHGVAYVHGPGSLAGSSLAGGPIDYPAVDAVDGAAYRNHMAVYLQQAAQQQQQEPFTWPPQSFQ